MTTHKAEIAHTPIDVYEIDSEGQEGLLRRLDEGAAVPEFRVCAACAPQHVLDRIDDGELDLADGDALAAQWPCEYAPLGPIPEHVKHRLHALRVLDAMRAHEVSARPAETEAGQ